MGYLLLHYLIEKVVFKWCCRNYHSKVETLGPFCCEAVHGKFNVSTMVGVGERDRRAVRE